MDLNQHRIDMVRFALAEDIGSGDVTAGLINPQVDATARLITREAMVMCGQHWLDEVFNQVDASVKVIWHCAEGQQMAPNDLLCKLKGPAQGILTGERSALNFVQLLSGTATATQRFKQAVAHTKCKILDTRKTIPGLRLAQKYAVTVGGGQNHRLGLYDRVLIKENHIASAGSIADAVQMARQKFPDVPVEVEVENLDEFRQAQLAQPDYIMLDDFPLADMRKAVLQNEAGISLEASGGVSLDTVAQIAETGVDFISIGAITKHVKAVDLSLRVSV